MNQYVVVCDHRRFGVNCSSVCNCRDNTSCNSITGHCKTGLCDPGWLGLSCDKGGNLIRRIRHQVSTQMSSEAKSTNSTFAVDGQLGPDPDKCQCCSITNNSPLSWWLLDLGKRYPLKSIVIFGRNNEDSYQQLKGFKLLLFNNTADDKPEMVLSNDSLHTIEENRYELTLNNTLARYIKIERPGVLTLCEVIVIEGNCIDGTFGKECVQFCHCADNKPCQTIHGYCQSPICKLGWMGKSCNESCSESTFGEECKQVCYCEESTCSSDYGICPGKCRYGYRGVHCNIEGIEEIEAAKTAVHSSSVVIGGSVAGGVVVIGILLLLVVLIYKQRMQRVKRNESENYYKTIHRNMAQVDDETTYDTIDISHDNQDQQNEEDNVRVTGL
ncbi:protein draper-like [Ruditapes philippinarum]|uniref:protein draper-like n=1 Tax=Ruditapes philippinarum TaxID=129788 RepID=UPI00295ACF68|nr:protein draper-like [Ruditapes philippinarum]